MHINQYKYLAIDTCNCIIIYLVIRTNVLLKENNNMLPYTLCNNCIWSKLILLHLLSIDRTPFRETWRENRDDGTTTATTTTTITISIFHNHNQGKNRNNKIGIPEIYTTLLYVPFNRSNYICCCHILCSRHSLVNLYLNYVISFVFTFQSSLPQSTCLYQRRLSKQSSLTIPDWGCPKTLTCSGKRPWSASGQRHLTSHEIHSRESSSMHNARWIMMAFLFFRCPKFSSEWNMNKTSSMEKCEKLGP